MDTSTGKASGGGGGGGGKGKKKSGAGPKVEFSARMNKVWSVSHGSKINALISDNLTVSSSSTAADAVVDREGSSSSNSDESERLRVSGRLFVADMTSDISIYELSHTLQTAAVIN